MFKEEPDATINCGQDSIRAVRLNADCQYALTCGSDRTIKLWNPIKQLLLKTYPGHSSDVVDCQAGPDSSKLASCSRDKSIIIWDVATGKILRRFRNLAPFTCICYNEDATLVLAGSVDGTVRIYDLKAQNSWEPVQILCEAKDVVTCCRVYKHNIMTTSIDGYLRSYDVRNGCYVADNFCEPLNHLSSSMDNRCQLVSSLKKPIKLVDKSSGQILSLFSGHCNKSFQLECQMIMNDSHIISGSEDGKVYCWDIVTSEIKGTINHGKALGSVVQSLCYCPKTNRLLTACGPTMYIWSPKEAPVLTDDH